MITVKWTLIRYGRSRILNEIGWKFGFTSPEWHEAHMRQFEAREDPESAFEFFFPDFVEDAELVQNETREGRNCLLYIAFERSSKYFRAEKVKLEHIGHVGRHSDECIAAVNRMLKCLKFSIAVELCEEDGYYYAVRVS